MIRRIALVLVPLALLGSTSVYAQNAADKVAPTIPETQIEPAELSSPYEFLSAATSADEFVIKAAALAQTNAGSADVKALAKQLAEAHTAMMTASTAAGKTDKVDIAAPSPDGEQSGLLAKLEALRGADFDMAYVESQLFAYQRTIAYYRGFSDNDGELATYANDSLPPLLTQYAALIATAKKVGIGDAAQMPTVQ